MATLNGTDVADDLVGTSGKDTIVGNAGNDAITGDSGAAPNLLVDGSFETAKVADGTWSNFAKVGGWQSDTRVEVWGKDFNGMTATDGDKLMELDYDNKQSNVWQLVQTNDGESYTFAFDYAMRPGTAAATNTIEVWWNNEKVGEVDPTSTDWTRAEYTVVGTGGKDRIEFREAAGDNDSLGGLIDNASLTLAGNGSADVLDGGAGNDMMAGNAGDDLMLGGGGDDTMSGDAGNDRMFGASSLGGAVDMDKFRIAEAVTGTVTFQGESAGYLNALGMYKIAADGTIYDVEVLFENASLKGSGGSLVAGKSSVDVDLAAGDRVGFFVVPDGYNQKDMAKLLGDEKGTFKFVDAKGNAGTIDGGPLTLVHVSEAGKETNIKSAYGTDVFHSTLGTAGTLNSDGLSHVVGSVDVVSGTVKIGFEDLKNGGDKDYDDSVFTFEIGQTNAALLARPADGVGTSSDKDVMTGGTGDDTMFGMADDDVMSGGDGDDRMWGNSGNDEMHGGAGNDEVRGGSGNDALSGGAGDDLLVGNSGDDKLDGGEGDDVLEGNSGNDVIADGAGNDAVDGGSGDDVFIAGEGDDAYRGGSGFDTIDFSAATGAMTIDMSKSSAVGMGSDTFTGVEAVIGGDYDDVVKGSKRADVIDGGAGDDTLRGLGGEDLLTGGKGADTFTWLAKDIVLEGNHLGVDVVTDFSVVDRDVLDFSALLAGTPTSLDGLVELTDTTEGTLVSVLLGKDMVDVVMLEGVHNIDANDLLKDGLILA
ncbi:MAG: DUF4114 domain-containing protein [Hyphomicrobiaceae bacterium]